MVHARNVPKKQAPSTCHGRLGGNTRSHGAWWGVGTTSNSKSLTVNVLKSKYECIYSICLHYMIYTIMLAIFICGFHAVLTQALPRQVQWHQNPQKRWSFQWMTPHKNQPFPPTTYSSYLPVWKGRGGKSHSHRKRTVHLLWGFPRPKSPGIKKTQRIH